MARSDPQLNIRIPEQLKARVETAARESGRSVTAEILARLQQTFEPASSPTSFRSLVERLVTEEKRSFTEGGLTLNLTVTIEPDGAAEAELSRTVTPAKPKAKPAATPTLQKK